MTSTSTESKLSKNHYVITQGEPHIRLNAGHPDHERLLALVGACPAGLYRLDEDGSLHAEFHGCLECGACRLLGEGTIIASWRYPEAGCGVEFRFG